MDKKGDENDNRNENHLSENLPSTYVKEQKASVFNSILIVVLTIIFIVGFWQLQKKGINFFVLIKYYIEEFYFNLQLVIYRYLIFLAVRILKFTAK